MQTDSRYVQVPQDRRALTRNDLDRGRAVTNISRGRWANADLHLLEHADTQWVVKDFRPRSFIVRNTIGRLLVSREIKGLRRLAGLNGVPAHAFRIDAHAIAYRFVPGTSLGLIS